MACNNEELKNKGFGTCSSCNCGGVFSEKWSGYLEYRIRVVAHNRFYLYKANQLLKQGTLNQLNQALTEI